MATCTSFLRDVSGLCSASVRQQDLAVPPHAGCSRSVGHLRRLRTAALQRLLSPASPPSAAVAEDDCNTVPVLCRLYGVWGSLSRAGQHDRARGLMEVLSCSALQRLVQSGAGEVDAVLRLLLCLAGSAGDARAFSDTVDTFSQPVSGGEFSWHAYDRQIGLPPSGTSHAMFCSLIPADVFECQPPITTSGFDSFVRCASTFSLIAAEPGHGCCLLGPHQNTSATTWATNCRLTPPSLPADPNTAPLGWFRRSRSRQHASQRRLQLRIRRQSKHPAVFTNAGRSSTSEHAFQDEVWRAVLASPRSAGGSWESRGYDPVAPWLRTWRTLRYITDCGPLAAVHLARLLEFREYVGLARTTPRRCVVSEQELLEDCRHLLLGCPSSSFWLSDESGHSADPSSASSGVFRLCPGLCTERISHSALIRLCAQWLICGGQMRRLRHLIANTTADRNGAVRAALANAVEVCLTAFRAVVISLPLSNTTHPANTTVMSVRRQLAPAVSLVNHLHSLCCTALASPSTPSSAMSVISHVYHLLINVTDSSLAHVTAFLFSRTIAPYLRFLSSWLFEGRCFNTAGEFPIIECEEHSEIRDERYWTDGFHSAVPGSASDHPVFVHSLSDKLFKCGQALSLLRLCVPDHVLCRATSSMSAETSGAPAHSPRLSVTFTMHGVESIRRRALHYENRMQCQLTCSFSKALEREREERLQLSELASVQARESLARIAESMAARRRQVMQQRKLQLEEIRREMDEDRVRRERHRLSQRLQDEENDGRVERQQMEDCEKELRQRQDRIRRLEQLVAGEWTSFNTVPTGSAADVQVVSGEERTSSVGNDDVVLTRNHVSDCDVGDLPCQCGERNCSECMRSNRPDQIPSSHTQPVADLAGVTEATTTDKYTAASSDKSASDVPAGSSACTDDSPVFGGSADDCREATGATLGTSHCVASSTPALASSTHGSRVSSTNELDEPNSPRADSSDAADPVTLRRRIASESAVARRRNRDRVLSGVLTIGSADNVDDNDANEATRAHALGGGVVRAWHSTWLVDRVGDTLVSRRPRTRSAHGHVSDSCLQNVIQRGEHHTSAAIVASSLARDRERVRNDVPPPPSSPPTAPPPLPVDLFGDGAALTICHSDWQHVSYLATSPSPGNSDNNDDQQQQTCELTSDSNWQLTCAGCVLQSVSVPLNVQLSLVSEALVNFLLIDAALVRHLAAMRRYLLLADGLFSAALCRALSSLARPGSCGRLDEPATLRVLLDAAVAACSSPDDQLAERLSFCILPRDGVQVGRGGDWCNPLALSRLVQLEYRIDWPLNVVITEHTRQLYGRVFHRQLALRRCLTALHQAFVQLPRRANNRLNSCSRGSWRVHVCRHQMQLVTAALCEHVADQLLEVGWHQLLAQLEHAHGSSSLDQLRSGHQLYMTAAMRRALLEQDEEDGHDQIASLVDDLARLVLKFHALVGQLVAAYAASSCDDQLLVSYEAAAVRVHAQFTKFARHLYQRVRRSASRRYHPRLNDLANRINFSGFFSR